RGGGRLRGRRGRGSGGSGVSRGGGRRTLPISGERLQQEEDALACQATASGESFRKWAASSRVKTSGSVVFSGIGRLRFREGSIVAGGSGGSTGQGVSKHLQCMAVQRAEHLNGIDRLGQRQRATVPVGGRHQAEGGLDDD